MTVMFFWADATERHEKKVTNAKSFLSILSRKRRDIVNKQKTREERK